MVHTDVQPVASINKMPVKTVHVSAPSRLHFGLLSFGNPKAKQFGGVGVMIERPGLQLCITAAEKFQVIGPLNQRAGEFAERWAQSVEQPASLACRIEMTHSAQDHLGLGVGTQLGLAVAAGLNAFFQFPVSSPAELACSVKRGLRSAVGTHGFFHGGLIAELGKGPEETLGRLDTRIEVPENWRFVLMRHHGPTGLAGKAERQAFSQLPPVPEKVTERLLGELKNQLLPAVAEQRFEEFSESVYRYGYMAGMCFAGRQGGPYCGARQAELVKLVRELGVSGVGQSSWGPTLFAVLPDQQAAEFLVKCLRNRYSEEELNLQISPPNSTGAKVECFA